MVTRYDAISLRSKRFRASSSRKLRREQKKGMTGEGEGKKETLALKPHEFEKLRSPTNAASDWCGAGSVYYLALETSIKPGILCLLALQIWSHLIFGRRWTDIYLNRVCAKVYAIRAIADRAVETSQIQFIGNDGVRI